MPKVTHYLTLEVGDRVEDIIKWLESLGRNSTVTDVEFVDEDSKIIEIEVS